MRTKQQLRSCGLFFGAAIALMLCTSNAAFSQAVTYNYSGGMQYYTVPGGVSSVRIQSYGAQGGAGSWAGGLGAYADGIFAVSPGQVLKVLVGGAGGAGTQGGGGGGSFVTDISNNPMCIAGGGGGANYGGYDYGSSPGTTSNNGQPGYCGGGCPGSVAGNGGSGGYGGGACQIYGSSGAGGGGLYGDGVACSPTCGGTAFVNGGWGGCGCGSGGAGGYGGGGGGEWCSWTGGGGGGGYSGGGGGTYYGNGGGGGSYNGGTMQTNTSGVRSGNGLVVITALPPPPCGWAGSSGYDWPAVPCGSFVSMPVGSGSYTHFSAVAGANYTVSTCGSAFDTDLTLYHANPAWTMQSWNQDNGPDCGGTSASLNFTATFTGAHLAVVNRVGCQMHDWTGQSAVLKIRQNSGPGCSCSPNQPASTWTGSVNSDWFNGSNWTNCVPGPNTNATIPVVSIYPVLNSGAAQVNTVTVNPGATLTVNAPATITATQ